MNTNIVFRNVPFSEELVQHARRCCSKLDTHLPPTEMCEVLLQSLGPGTDVIACVIAGEQGELTVQHVDADAFRAVDGAIGMVLARLRPPAGWPARSGASAAADLCEAS